MEEKHGTEGSTVGGGGSGGGGGDISKYPSAMFQIAVGSNSLE